MWWFIEHISDYISNSIILRYQIRFIFESSLKISNNSLNYYSLFYFLWMSRGNLLESYLGHLCVLIWLIRLRLWVHIHGEWVRVRRGGGHGQDRQHSAPPSLLDAFIVYCLLMASPISINYFPLRMLQKSHQRFQATSLSKHHPALLHHWILSLKPLLQYLPINSNHRWARMIWSNA